MATTLTDQALPALWTFERGDAFMTIAREVVDGQLTLTIAEPASTRSVPFDDVASLTTFQVELERRLVADGWHLTAFAPDMRSGEDRRRASRPGPDRRQS